MSKNNDADGRRCPRVPGASTRADKVVSWIGWHIGELAGVIVPGVVALSVTPWAAAVSVVAGAGWAMHEVRLARQQRAIGETRALPTLSVGQSEEDAPESDVAADPAIGWGDVR